MNRPAGRARGAVLAAGVLAAGLLAGCAASPRLPGFDPAADAPPPRRTAPPAAPAFASYAQALSAWRSPEAVEAWIGAGFEYDDARALRLSESGRAAGAAPEIHAPAAFFARPVGICVDLARFAVETVGSIAPELEPRYLMIEFDPALRAGQVLRRHWIASFRRGGGLYFFGDSKRPGHVAGPYPTVDAFVAEYAAFRQRTVVAWRERESFRRQAKSPSKRRDGGAARPAGAPG